MSDEPEILFSASAEGRPVAEAEIADVDGARALAEAARAAGAHLAWAHSPADLTSAGFQPRPGYRRLVGQAERDRVHLGGDGLAEGHVGPLAADEDSAALWARAFEGQWGHKTPQEWPFDLPAGTVTLCLRRAGEIVGVCRVEPETGAIDAPGLVPGCREAGPYRLLLTAALAEVTGPVATVESWGEPPELTAVAESLGLTTAAYEPGWELDLHT